MPDLDRAAQLACQALLRHGSGRLPVDVDRLLTALPNVRLLEWSQAAEAIRRSGQDPQQLYWELKDKVGAFQFLQTAPQGDDRIFVCMLPDQLPQRRRFAMAHELGHILLGHTGESYDANREANCFASHLILPRAAALQYISRGLTQAQLAGIFGVSRQVVELSARDHWAAPREYDRDLLRLFRLDAPG